MTPRIPGRRYATLADHGWTLVEVEHACRARDGVSWAPAEARRGLRPGALAQLLFAAS